MKLGFIIDSSSGLTKDEAIKKGWEFLPLYININSTEYADGITINAKKYYEIITLDSVVKTSASNPKEILNLFEKVTKKYDHIIVYPLSSELSSQNNNLITFSKQYKNVHVVESFALSEIIVKEIEHLEKINHENPEITIKELLAEAKMRSQKSFGLLMPSTMDWLVKGGRVSGAAAALANLLKIIPVIKFDGKLEKHGKGRTLVKTLIKSCKYLIENYDIENEYDIIFINAGNEKGDILQRKLENIIGKSIKTKIMPNVITTHTGPGAIALILQKKI